MAKSLPSLARLANDQTKGDIEMSEYQNLAVSSAVGFHGYLVSRGRRFAWSVAYVSSWPHSYSKKKGAPHDLRLMCPCRQTFTRG